MGQIWGYFGGICVGISAENLSKPDIRYNLRKPEIRTLIRSEQLDWA